MLRMASDASQFVASRSILYNSTCLAKPVAARIASQTRRHHFAGAMRHANDANPSSILRHCVCRFSPKAI